MPVKVPENRQVSPYFMLFIIYGIQVGIGVLSYERVLAEEIGNDGWITILISGILMEVILWMVYRVLEKNGGDLIDIHKELFGKWLGGLFSVIFSLYFLTMSLVVMRTYAEIVQVWMFPHLSYFAIAGMVGGTAYTFVSGGFRSITGISFLSIVYSTPLFISLFFPLPYVHYENLLPMFHHSPLAIISAAHQMILNFIGFEVLFLAYPFIKQPKKAKKWGYYAIYLTTMLYILLFIITILYYPRRQLKGILWPTIEIWKIVDLPFMERFEYIGITIWFFTILPNIALSLWAASRGFKRVFNINQRITAILMSILIYVIGFFLNSRDDIDLLNAILSNIGFGFLCGYVPFLFVLQSIVYKVKKRNGKT